MTTKQLYLLLILMLVLWVILFNHSKPRIIIQPVEVGQVASQTRSYQSNRTDNLKTGFGLALSGGGAKGFTHLGVLKALEEHNLQPDILCGVSSGAVLAALYADGYPVDSIIALYDRLSLIQYVDIDWNESGLLSLKKFKQFLDTTLRAKTFSELKIPLKVVVTNLDKGESVVLYSGSLTDALIASCSVPILFDPWVIGGQHYVDGGLLHNLPAFAIRKDCRFLVGVSLGPIQADAYEKTIWSIAMRSYRFVFRSNAVYDKSLCDVLIEPQGIGKFHGGNVSEVQPLFKLGYDFTNRLLDSLSKSQNNPFQPFISVEAKKNAHP